MIINKSFIKSKCSRPFLKRVLIVALTLIVGSQYAHAVARPGGRYERYRAWKPEWSQIFTKCFDLYGKKLAQKTGAVSDHKLFCASNEKPPDFWLSIFIPLAGKESGFKENARGQNGARVPKGLFQMDEKDMSHYHCPGKPDEAKGAICCAIKIANQQASKFNVISSPAGKPANGIMSAFWQPMRNGKGGNGFWQPMRNGKGGNGRSSGKTIDNTANLNDIMKTSKKLCSTHPSDGKKQNGDFNGGSSVALRSIYDLPKLLSEGFSYGAEENQNLSSEFANSSEFDSECGGFTSARS